MNQERDTWAEECPEFNDFEYQMILDWVYSKGGSLEWEDTAVDAYGRVAKLADFGIRGHYSFGWKFGVIGFDAFEQDEKDRAEKAAAMFVWLWLKKKVPAEYAEKCAEAYAKNYTFFRDDS